jgi:hypothetical protein
MAKKVSANGKTFTFDDNVTNEQIGTAIDEYFSSLKKNESLQPDAPIGTQPSKTGFEPFQAQVDTSKPSVILSDEQKLRQEQERIGKRFETTLLNTPTEFGKVANFVDAAKKVKDTLPQAPQFRKYGQIPMTQPTEMTEGQRLGESLTKGTDVRELITDKLTGKKTGLQKQLENAENAFRAYQGDEIANQAQGYIRPEETLKIKQELGFGERMSDAGTNFVNRLERFPYNTSLALGQTLTTLLGEDLGSNAYAQITRGGNAELHRMEAFDKLAKLDAETKYSKGVIDSIQDLDLVNIAGGVVDAVGSLVSTVVTSAPTAGLGLYGDMVGGGLYDFNSTKARRLGLTVDELYDTNQNEFFVPAIINGAAAKLEGIGLKGIKSAIMNNMSKGAGQKFALVGHGMNKEGVTEWLQTGMEVVNNSLAEGKPLPQAVEESVKTLFSKKGTESYLMGAIASGAAIGGGRILKGLFSDKSKKKASEAIQSIEQQQEELSNPELSNESRVFIFENIKNNVKQLVDSVDEDVDTAESLSAEQRKNITILNDKISSLEVVANDPAASEETKSRALESIKGIQETIDDITSKKSEAPTIEQPTFDTEESIGEEVRESNRKFQAGEIDQATWEQEQKDLNTRAENIIPVPEEVVSEDIEAKEDNVEKKKQEQLENKVKELESQRKNLRSEDGTVAAEKMPEFNRLGKELNEAKRAATRGNSKNSILIKRKGEGEGEKSDPVFLSKEEKEEAADLIEQVIQNSNTVEEVVKKVNKLGYVFDIANANLFAIYLSDRYNSNAPQVGNNKSSFQDWVNGKQLTTQEQQTKPKEDAIQVETAGQVPVQPEAPVGEEVEQGKPEAKPKVVTEEGVKAEEVDEKYRKITELIPVSQTIDGVKIHEIKTTKEIADILGISTNSAYSYLMSLGDDKASRYGYLVRGNWQPIEGGSNPKAQSVGWQISSPEVKIKNITKVDDLKDVESTAKAFTAEGGNKVVDEKGEPITVYHTTTAENIQEFRTSGEIETLGGKVKNEGAYFTPNKGEYANKGGNEYAVQISIKNPYITTDQKESAIISPEKKAELVSKGHDGVILMRNGKPAEYIVFDKSQIKSESLPTQEQTPAQEIEQLREKEQAELKAAIPNADQYLTDGKVDRTKITDAKELKKFDEIYDKYDKLITPLLPEKETSAPKQEAPKKAKSLPKPKVATRLAFKKAVDLFYDISGTEGSAKKRTLVAKRKVFLEQNPSIKYIDDNWKDISKQLEAKGLITKKGNCP